MARGAESDGARASAGERQLTNAYVVGSCGRDSQGRVLPPGPWRFTSTTSPLWSLVKACGSTSAPRAHRWLWLAHSTAADIWDEETWAALPARQLKLGSTVARGGIERPTFRFSGGVMAYTNVFQLVKVG